MIYKYGGFLEENGHGRKQFFVFIIFGLLLLFISVGLLQAARSPSEEEVLVLLSFHETISDEAVVDILASSEARPRRIFTVASGLYGSYRAPESPICRRVLPKNEQKLLPISVKRGSYLL